MRKNDVIVLDNGGETFDRYTIILTKDGEMFGASTNPFHPQGFGQYCMNVCEARKQHRFYDHKKGCYPDWLIRNELKAYLADCSHVGKKVKIASLPEEVQKFINQLLIEEQA